LSKWPSEASRLVKVKRDSRIYAFEKIACSDQVERAGGEPDFNLETAVEREKAV